MSTPKAPPMTDRDSDMVLVPRAKLVFARNVVAMQIGLGIGKASETATKCANELSDLIGDTNPSSAPSATGPSGDEAELCERVTRSTESGLVKRLRDKAMFDLTLSHEVTALLANAANAIERHLSAPRGYDDGLEAAAKWHERQCHGGHCGEGSSEIIIRQRVNGWHEENAASIRALKTGTKP